VLIDAADAASFSAGETRERTAYCAAALLTFIHAPLMQARKFRHLQQLVAAPLVLAFGELPVASAPQGGGLASADAARQQPFSILTQALPPNVHLLTLQALGGGRVLLRLAHLYEGNRDGKGWCAFRPSPNHSPIARMTSNAHGQPAATHPCSGERRETARPGTAFKTDVAILSRASPP
jgi:hypothetical protein